MLWLSLIKYYQSTDSDLFSIDKEQHIFKKKKKKSGLNNAEILNIPKDRLSPASKNLPISHWIIK